MKHLIIPVAGVAAIGYLIYLAATSIGGAVALVNVLH